MHQEAVPGIKITFIQGGTCIPDNMQHLSGVISALTSAPAWDFPQAYMCEVKMCACSIVICIF